MIQKVKEKCPGDCANCAIAQNIPNFDYTFCMMYQMFKGMQSLSNEVQDIKRAISADHVHAVVDESAQVDNEIIENNNEGV